MQPRKTNRISSRTRQIIAAATVMAVSTATPILPVLPRGSVFSASAQEVVETGTIKVSIYGLPERARPTLRMTQNGALVKEVPVTQGGTFEITAPVGDVELELVGLPEGVTSSERESVTVFKSGTGIAHFAITSPNSIRVPIGGTYVEDIGVRVSGAGLPTREQRENYYQIFPDLPEGEYKVEFFDVPEGVFTTGPVYVNVSSDSQVRAPMINASLETGTISGRVNGLRPGQRVEVQVDNFRELTTLTDSDGFYELRDVPTGSYHLRVVENSIPKGFSAPESVGANLFKNPAIRDLDLDMVRETGTLYGSVSNVPSGASLAVRATGTDDSTTGLVRETQLENGDYRFDNMPTGEYRVEILGLPEAFAVSNPGTVAVSQWGADRADFEVSRLTSTVSGRVTGPDGKGVGDVTVQAGDRTARTNANGDYTITDVPTGETTIEVTDGVPGGFSVSGAQSKNVTTAGESGVNFTTSRLTGSVAGRVTDPDGKGVAGVTVQAGDRTARTNTNGDYTITGVPTGDTTIQVTGGVPGGYSVSGAQSKNVTTAGVRDVNFTTSYNRVTGTVLVVNNASIPQPVAGASVTLRDGSANGRSLTTDDNGRATFNNLLPGSYPVEVAGATGYSGTSGTLTLDVGADGQTTLQVGALNQVTGSVNDDLGRAVDGASVTVTGPNNISQQMQTDANGRFDAGHLPAGTYTVNVAGTGTYEGTQQQVTVVAGQPTDPAALTVNLVRGSIAATVTGPVAPDSVVAVGGPKNESVRLTNVNGRYEAKNLYPGSYTLTATAPANYSVTPSTVEVTVAPAQTATASFGITANNGTVSGSVVGEDKKPVAGVQVELVGFDGKVVPVTVNPDGSLKPVSVRPGDYTVRVTPPSGYDEPADKSITINPGERVTVDPIKVLKTPVATPTPKPTPTTPKPTPTPKPSTSTAPTTSTSTQPQDLFTWDRIETRQGTIATARPKIAPNAPASNANVTFQTTAVGKVGEDGKVQPVNRDESWIKVDADGSIVATPPADAEPGEYRVEVVASNGERDTVTVVVAPPPSMKDIYSLRAGEVDPVDVPAGGQRTAAAPRASVFKDGLRDPNRPVPSGSRYEVDYPGATVDIRGRVTYAPPLDAKRGIVRIPVTVTFSDNSVGTFELAFNVTEPMLADQITLAYESGLSVAPGSSAAVFLTDGSSVPEATTFELRDGARLGGWAASVDADTGVISVTAPRDGGEALTVPVVAFFSDGSSLELDARVEVAGEGRQASVSKLAYDPASGQRGATVTLPLKGAALAGTVFKLSDPDLKNTVVDPQTGELTVTVPEQATEAEPLTIRVRASYPDKSIGEIVGRVNVQEQAKLFPPKFGPLTVAVGDSEIIPQFTNVPVGSKFSIRDDARRAGWTVKINEETGQLEVTTDETVPDGDQFTVPIQVTYPDGSVHEVQVPITAKRPAPAPTPEPVPDTEDSLSGSSTGDWVAILLGVLAILGAAGYTAWLNQDEIRRVLGQFGFNF